MQTCAWYMTPSLYLTTFWWPSLLSCECRLWVTSVLFIDRDRILCFLSYCTWTEGAAVVSDADVCVCFGRVMSEEPFFLYRPVAYQTTSVCFRFTLKV